MTSSRPILHIPAEAGAVYQVGTYRVTVKLDSGATSGALAVGEAAMPPGSASPPLHTHPEAEVLYILEGE